MNIEIKSRFSGVVLFSHDEKNNSIKFTVEEAVKAGTKLDGANLARANLDGANLAGAYLAGANLASANLAGAYLASAYLAGANLDGAYLDGGEILIGESPVFQIGPIGSRRAYLLAYITNKGLRLRAGCFFGDRDSFEKKLSEDHGNDIHGEEYRAALAMIDVHVAIWTPKN